MNGYTFERRELKYRITDAQRAALEAAFGARMVPDEHGESTICNIYYDTADYRLIRASLEKPAYKEKLRLRSYGVTEPGGEVFLELKKKYKGIVYKRRITLPEDAAGEFIAGRARSVNTPQSSQQPQRKTAAAVNTLYMSCKKTSVNPISFPVALCTKISPFKAIHLLSQCKTKIQFLWMRMRKRSAN